MLTLRRRLIVLWITLWKNIRKIWNASKDHQNHKRNVWKVQMYCMARNINFRLVSGYSTCTHLITIHVLTGYWSVDEGGGRRKARNTLDLYYYIGRRRLCRWYYYTKSHTTNYANMAREVDKKEPNIDSLNKLGSLVVHCSLRTENYS